MTCISPPELSDHVLLAYIDGEVASGVEGHIKTCSHCQGRMAALERFSGELRMGLFRVECPEPSVLGEYQLNLLSKERAREVRQHIDTCPICAGELAELDTYLQGLRPYLHADTKHPIRTFVGKLIEKPDIPPLTGQPPTLQPVFQRGSETKPLLYRNRDFQVALEIHRDPDHPGKYALSGLLMTASAGEWHAQLRQEGNALFAVPLDPGGNFTLTNVPEGTFDLALLKQDVEFLILGLSIPTTPDVD